MANGFSSSQHQEHRFVGRAVPAQLRRIVHRLAGSVAYRTRADVEGDPVEGLTAEDFVASAYLMLLQRAPDAAGMAGYLAHLAEGTMTRSEILSEIRGGDEFWGEYAMKYTDPLLALHRSRCLFVQMLPEARRILDLGGTHQDKPEGAFVRLGYPYDFELLSVVDLPAADRHALYKNMTDVTRVESDRGPVDYHYRSMVDRRRDGRSRVQRPVDRTRDAGGRGRRAG